MALYAVAVSSNGTWGRARPAGLRVRQKTRSNCGWTRSPGLGVLRAGLEICRAMAWTVGHRVAGALQPTKNPITKNTIAVAMPARI
jgi:hypothetical protein